MKQFLLLKKLLIIIPALLLISTGAHATYIDFTDSAFSGGNGLGSYQYIQPEPTGDVTITFEAVTSGSTLWWDSTDGFGIQGSAGYEVDEIDSTEMLRISFSESVSLTQINITDLFMENSTTELGFYSINGGGGTLFGATQANTPGNNGDLILSGLTATGVNNITFYAPGFLGHEFSVAGIEVIPNPEPGTLLLLGSGLIGFAILRNKFRKR